MTDFATMTNAQLNGFAGRRDPRFAEWADKTRDENMPRYTTCHDLAIALLGRWGYEWERMRYDDSPFCVTVTSASGEFVSIDESPTCDTARALMIAACGLKESEEG